MRRHGRHPLFLAALLAGTAPLGAQSTGVPSFNAPYRAFTSREFGAAISFVPNADGAFEGLYRIGSGRFDVGFRGGVILGSGPAAADVLIFGAEFRQQIIQHDEEFPADGAVILGAGARLGDFNQLLVPLGLSLGRRLDVEDSEVSIVPFVQPTVLVVGGDGSGINFALGFGADFRLTRMFDLRVSAGLGDIEGISFSAVWIR